MTRFATVFGETWAAVVPTSPRTPDLATPAADRRLTAILERARAAHPKLAVDELVFARHLARCAACVDAAPLEAAESLAVDDLYLACACALGVPGAAATFDVRCGDRLRVALAAVIKSEDLRREMEQHA